MRLIDADALKTKKVYSKERHENVVPVAEIDWMPTVDAVPSTDVEELTMRLIGAEAAINGMREQINRMVIINSEKVSVVRCGECAYRRRCILLESNAVDSTKIDWSEWYCADGVRDINVPSKSDERREE